MFDRKLCTAALILATPLAMFTGCKSTPDDATLNTNVQNALKADAAIAQQPIQVSTSQGVVTLTGNVTDDTAKTVAARDAAMVKGVKEVVDNTTVNGVQVAPTITTAAAPTTSRPATKQEQVAIAQKQPLPPPPTGSSAPPPPPPPVIRTVTVPAGATVAFRITEGLSSASSQDGQPFNGVITRSVVRDGLVVIPAGSAASGRVVDAKDAGHFKGHSILSVELTAVRRHGKLMSIQTEPYVLEGKNRGTNSVEKIGGGAAVGAVLGGIFGGGKGAAIGSLAGAGGGTAWQAATKGQQVAIPSETVISFRLAAPVSVQTSEPAPDEDGAPQLQTR